MRLLNLPTGKLPSFIACFLIVLAHFLLATPAHGQTVVNQGPYESHYLLTCPSTGNLAAGRAICRGLGNGYDIATIPTSTAQSAIAGIFPSATAAYVAWVGMTDEATEGTWRFVAGRLEGLTYSNGATCATSVFNPFGVSSWTFSHCWWVSGEPNDSGSNEDCAQALPTASSRMNDIACSGTAPCVLCERSPCKMGIDCHPSNTQSMSGSYFPNCACVCKAGYWGDKCEKVATNQGPYESHYLRTCTAGNFGTGRAACKALGAGWDLATIPTSAAQSVVAAIQPATDGYVAWVGMTDEATEGTWRFVAGRLEGLTYSNGATCATSVYTPLPGVSYSFNYCLWNGGEPNDASGEDCGVAIPSIGARLNDLACTGSAPCAVCERSPCKMGIDCHPSNTQSMSGSYFPNCVCTCKPSYWGAKCEKQSVVDQGPYVSHYDYTCSLNVDMNGGRAACKALGEGWDLATMPTAAAQAAVAARVPSAAVAYNAWVGVEDSAVEGTWRLTAGRLSGLTYSFGATCASKSYTPLPGVSYSFGYCLWNGGEPNDNGANEDCGQVTAMTTTGALNDVACSTPLACVVCERSPCKMGIDCHPSNTQSMSGSYFPNCACTCKPSFWGAKCEKQSVVDQGPYVSYYHYICPINVTFASSRIACKALGDGWDLGTIPTAAAQAEVNQLIPQVGSTYAAWVGISDAETEMLFKYATGRLANLTYSNWSTCWPSVYSPFGLPGGTTFSHCWWNTNEPTNTPTEFSTEEDCAYIVGMTNGALNDYECSRFLPCALCERSPCKMGLDCHPLNTVSMTGTFSPNCACTCKPSYWGAKCEKQSVVDQGPYVSHYDYICPMNVNVDGARAACKALGDGWDLGTIPTLAAQAVVNQRNPVNGYAWVGVSDARAEGVWLYTSGRLANRTYSHNASCQATLFDPYGVNKTVFGYCAWEAGEPSNTPNPLVSSKSEDCAFLYQPPGRLNDYECYSSTLNCVLCERSPCELGVDCHPLNTLSMSGTYFPNCQCVCKPGAGGGKCRYPHASPTLTASSLSLTPSRSLVVHTRSLAASESGSQPASHSLSGSASASSTAMLSATRSAPPSATRSGDATQSALRTATRSRSGTATGSASSLLSPSPSRAASGSVPGAKSGSVVLTSTHSPARSASAPRSESRTRPHSATRPATASAARPASESVPASASLEQQATPSAGRSASSSPSAATAATHSLAATLSVDPAQTPHIDDPTASRRASSTGTRLLTPSQAVSHSQPAFRTQSLVISPSGEVVSHSPTIIPLTPTLIIMSTTTTALIASSATNTNPHNTTSPIITTTIVSHLATTQMQNGSTSTTPLSISSGPQTTIVTVPSNSTTDYTTVITSTQGNSTNTPIVGTSYPTTATTSPPHGTSLTATSLTQITNVSSTLINNTSTILPTTPPTTTTTTEAPIIYNAPELDNEVRVLLYAAAIDYSLTAGDEGSAKCRRLELILTRHAIVTPFRWLADTYATALGINGILLLASAGLGAATWIAYYVYRKITREPHEEATSLSKAAASVRFPATAIQVFIALAPGTAVAAGLGIGQGAGSAGGGVVALIILLITPLIWTGAARVFCHDRSVEVSEPPPYTPKGGIVMLCAATRPSQYAKVLGPIIADLNVHNITGPLLPIVVPILLLLTSIIVSAAGACTYAPITAGVVYGIYALFVAAVRPYLGLFHNALEVLMALATAVCLVIWHTELVDMGGEDELSPIELSSITALVLLSNCRYPFALARALDVVFPKVSALVSVGASPANDDAEFTLLCETEDESIFAKVLPPGSSREDIGGVVFDVEDQGDRVLHNQGSSNDLISGKDSFSSSSTSSSSSSSSESFGN